MLFALNLLCCDPSPSVLDCTIAWGAGLRFCQNDVPV